MTTNVDIEYLHAVLSPAGIEKLRDGGDETDIEIVESLVSEYDDNPTPDADGYYTFTGLGLAGNFSYGFSTWFWSTAMLAFEPGVRVVGHEEGDTLYVVVDGQVVAHEALIVYPTFETFGDIIEKVQVAQR